MTVTTQSPDAPLLIFKNTALWAFFGDILDDPSAELLQLSAEIGCPAPLSIVETPFGTIFLGLDSVYLVRPDALTPEDIGFAIAPSIKQIPVARRAFSCAVYHRGFYKLAITPSGGTANTIQWWLDLRRNPTTTHAWWGPHTTPPVVAFASARQDPTEIDRALQLQSKGNVAAMDQPQVLTDLIDDTTGTTTQAVQSKIKLATLDDGAPFGRKVWKRLRAIARADQTTVIGVSVSADNGAQTMADSLAIEAMGGQIWDVTWDVTWSGGV